MTKRDLIDGIMEINGSATADFLVRFDNADLHAYLESLHSLQTPRLTVDPGRFSGHFAATEEEATSSIGLAVVESSCEGEEREWPDPFCRMDDQDEQKGEGFRDRIGRLVRRWVDSPSDHEDQESEFQDVRPDDEDNEELPFDYESHRDEGSDHCPAVMDSSVLSAGAKNDSQPPTDRLEPLEQDYNSWLF